PTINPLSLHDALPISLFRNQLMGTEPNKTQGNTEVINIWGYNRFVNIVGNVLGTSGYHKVYEDSRTPSGTTGHPERSIYLLGYTDRKSTRLNSSHDQI